MGKRHRDFDKMVEWLGNGEMDVRMMLRVGIVAEAEVVAICRTLEDSPWFHRPRNMRFWVRWNCGWVKLTLTRRRPIIKLWRSEYDREGYTQTFESYSLAPQGKGVDCVMGTWAKDCDGPHEWHWEGFCHYTELRDQVACDDCDGKGTWLCGSQVIRCCWCDGTGSSHERPKWQERSSSQRDAFAEAAGY